MKRKIALIIAIMTLTFVFCSCDTEKNSEKKTDEEIYSAAMVHIAQGHYELGYSGLLSVKSYDKAAKALENFFYLPSAMTEIEPEDKTANDYDMVNFVYNKNGLVQVRNLTVEGVAAGTESYKYEGNLLKSSTFSKNKDDACTKKYTFNSDGNLIEIFMTDADGNFAKVDFKYDDKGRVTESTESDYDGTETKSSFAYGDDDRLKTKTSYREVDGKKTTVLTCSYTYNEQGLLASVKKVTDKQTVSVLYSDYKLYYSDSYRDIMLYY